MTMREVVDVHLALRRRGRRARPHAHHGHVGHAHRRRLQRRDRRGDTFECRDGGARQRRLQSAIVPALRGRYRHRSRSSRRSTIAIRTACPRAACSSSARPQRACSWPTKSTAQAAGHAVGRRARPSAAHVSRARRAVVDGRLGRLESALRRGRRPVRARGGCRRRNSSGTPRADDARPQRAQRSASSSSAGWPPIRDGRALFSGGLRNLFALADLKMERLLDTFDEWARADGRDGDVGAAGTFRADARAVDIAAVSSILAAGRFARSSGRPDSVPTTAGFTCRCSTRRAISGTTAASSTRRDCTRWGCRCSAAGSRASSTGQKTTRGI